MNGGNSSFSTLTAIDGSAGASSLGAGAEGPWRGQLGRHTGGDIPFYGGGVRPALNLAPGTPVTNSVDSDGGYKVVGGAV